MTGLSLSPDGTETSILQLGIGTADIWYDESHSLLLIPNSAENKVSAYLLNGED